jgi:hypothetical protein
MDIFKAIIYEWPNAKFTISNNDYRELKWFNNSPKPSFEQIVEAWEGYKNKAQYLDFRKAEYQKQMSAHDMLIALWESVIEGRNDKVNSLQAKRLKIKEQFPKGDQS